MMIRNVITGAATGLALAALPLVALSAEPYRVMDDGFPARVQEAQEFQREMAKERLANEAEARRIRLEHAGGNEEANRELHRARMEKAREVRQKNMEGFPERVKEAQEYQREMDQNRMETWR
ncbi:MAG: hypothetical protein LIP28_00020 [Deltaproteobacteria bacterium]|nr:hypothetical protein [Deltaproteobacteria bacterium]